MGNRTILLERRYAEIAGIFDLAKYDKGLAKQKLAGLRASAALNNDLVSVARFDLLLKML